MIGLIFASRMLGIFMIFPVLALYVNHYPDASMTLVGCALGSYGLLQALLQLPLAALSDKYGRKRVILAGLCLFAFGSVIAASATTLWGITIGRAIQGAGAIGATLLAYLSDTTRPAVRTRAMAIVGICIGATFTLSVAIGPIVDAYFGIKGLFWLTAVLGLFGMGWVMRMPSQQADAALLQTLSFAPKELAVAIHHRHLWRLYLSIFVLHAVLTMSFLVVPHKVQAILALDKAQSWQFYVPVLIGSLLCVGPFLRRADDEAAQKKGIMVAVIGLFCVMPIWLQTQQTIIFVIMSVLFFAFFNYLEASMPAMVSKVAPSTRRGLVLGVYSSVQFLGLFFGGVIGGVLCQYWPNWGVAVLSTMLLGLWLMVISNISFKKTYEFGEQKI
ncbi:MFS transporter [Candidatus Berkiella cookevillensis]|nr:MFS transporter [Candidatus Berkiella cookevillensis]MCS5709360.1 MFS transporter [Candidatus Berkiella cookevillensis]